MAIKMTRCFLKGQFFVRILEEQIEKQGNREDMRKFTSCGSFSRLNCPQVHPIQRNQKKTFFKYRHGECVSNLRSLKF